MDFRNIKSLTTLNNIQEEIEQKRLVSGRKELAAFIIGTCYPDWSYQNIADCVGVSRVTLWQWGKDEEFAKLVKQYGQEYIDKYWVPVLRGQMRRALKGDTLAAGFVAKVQGKVIDSHRLEHTVPEDVRRLLAMSAEELKAYIADLRAKAKGVKDDA